MQMKQEHARIVSLLQSIPQVSLVSSETSWIVLELDKEINADHLSEKLLTGYNILVAPLTLQNVTETRQFLLASIKSVKDNDSLIQALQQELE